MNRIMLDHMDTIKSNHNIPRRGRSMIIGASRAVPTAILLKNMIRHLLLGDHVHEKRWPFRKGSKSLELIKSMQESIGLQIPLSLTAVRSIEIIKNKEKENTLLRSKLH